MRNGHLLHVEGMSYPNELSDASNFFSNSGNELSSRT